MPDPLLRQVSKPVDIDAETKRLAQDMLDTMYDAPGIGLAAVRSVSSGGMLVIDVSRGRRKDAAGLLESEILTSSDDRSAYEEGCLPSRTIMRKSSARQRSR